MLRDLLAFLVLLGLCLIIWFLGPRIGLGEGWRITLIILIAGCYLAVLAVQKILAIRRSLRIERQLREQARRQLAEAPAQQQDALREVEQRFSAALSALRRSKLGSAALAELPWYLLIGPPGSGKTTMIRESGLNVPALGGEVRATRGIGGTRNCDWWFTDRAIFVDTAGRYTSEPDDHEEWGGFLRTLRRYRRSRAINGCLVTIPLAELEELDEPSVERYAEAIRDRLSELVEHLRVVFPVYLMLTKCDQLPGFHEFFAPRDKSESEQVLGATLPWQLEDSQSTVQDQVARGFAGILQRLRAERVQALGADHALAAKAAVYRFPIRLRNLEQRLQQFVGAVFRDNPFQESARLRGIYLTSATQELPSQVPAPVALGAPPSPASSPAPAAPAPSIPAGRSGPPPLSPAPGLAANPKAEAATASSSEAERVAALLAGRSPAKAAAMPAPTISITAPPTEPSSPRRQPPALGRRPYFLRQFFARLVVADAPLAHPHRARSRSLHRRRQLLAASAAAILILGLSTLLWSYAQQRAMIARSADQAQVLTGLSAHAASADVLIALDRFRPALEDLQQRAAARSRWRPSWFQVGGTVERWSRQLYLAQLQRLILTPVFAGLEQELEQLRRRPGKGQTEFDQIYDLYRSYLMLSGQQPVDPLLLRRTLQDQGRWVASLDRPSAEQQQQALRNFALFLGLAEHAEDWAQPANQLLIERLNFELGAALWVQESYRELLAAGRELFPPVTRDSLLSGSGRNLLRVDYQIPGIFTRNAYEDWVALAIEDKAEALQLKYTSLGIERARTDLASRLRLQYRNDYVRNWWRFLDRAGPAPYADLNDAVGRIRALTAPDSPYRDFVRAVWQQRQFEADGSFPLAASEGEFEWLDASMRALADAGLALRQYSERTIAGQRAAAVTELRNLLASFDSAVTAVDAALQIIDNPGQRRALRVFLLGIIDQVRVVLSAELGSELNQRWQQQVARPFAERVAPYYPINRSAEEAVPLQRFAHFFNPRDGLIPLELAVIDQLAGLRMNGRPLVVTSRSIEALRTRVQQIGILLFANGGNALDTRFTLRLIQREGVRDAVFQVNQQRVSLYERPDASFDLRWTGDSPSGALIAINVRDHQWLRQDRSGRPWGLLELIEAGEVSTLNGGLRVVWTFSSRIFGLAEQYRAEVHLLGEHLDRVLMPGYFSELRVPERAIP